MDMSKIKAVIFDMDGVLIDAKEWHYESLNRALALFGYEISRYDHLITYDGLPTKKKLEMLSMERGLPERLHPYINMLKQKYTIERVYMDCHPVFTHQYALSKLRSEGYHLVCASNSVRKTIQLMMELSELLQYLDFFLSNQDVTKAKPDPEIYITVIERLGLKADECVVCEDNKNGIIAAKRAGTHVLEISTVYDVNYDNIKNFINKIEAGDVR